MVQYSELEFTHLILLRPSFRVYIYILYKLYFIQTIFYTNYILYKLYFIQTIFYTNYIFPPDRQY